MNSQRTAKLAVLGNPVAHSRSPEIHALFARQAGIELSYEKIEVPAHGFAETARAFLADGLGFNVTLPCKGDAYNFVDVCGEQASMARAVNTVSRQPDGRLRGDNTDGPGLVRDLETNLGWPVGGRRLLVLGAGGAVSGVLASLLSCQPALLHLHNRTMSRAEDLAARFNGVAAVAAGDLRADYDMVINGTSAGLTGSTDHLPAGIIHGRASCYDMVYGARRTAFLAWCLDQAQCSVADGLGMLVEQAALSFNIWFNQSVSTAEVIRTLRAAL